MPEQYDPSVVDESRMEIGNEVGDLAMGYFGRFVEVPYSRDKSEMIAKTKRLLEAGTEVIAEASFAYEGNFCSVDILRVVTDGYELVEVKSSTESFPERRENVKSIYVDDMAYQTYVLTHCGLKVKKVSLMQLNRDYFRVGELDIQELFVLTDYTDQVFAMQQDMARIIAEITAIAEQADEPNMKIGSGCGNPYECGYKKWCFRGLPENNVFQIGWSLWGSKKDEAYQAGLVTFEDVMNSSIGLNDKQMRQIRTATMDLPPHIDIEAIRKFLSTIRYPLYHLDFETFQQAIPQWDNVSPYTQIPFQYSLHIQESPCGETVHREFLAKEGVDPRRLIAERLCEDIPESACVMAYYMSFEKGRIKELANLFPDLSGHLMSLHDGMVDLAVPFQSGVYYCREMKGSYSIKSVLPALCPGDPELDYKGLGIVHNGGEAMAAFASLTDKTLEETAAIRSALLSYCRLDTLAMVKILEKLYEISA